MIFLNTDITFRYSIKITSKGTCGSLFHLYLSQTCDAIALYLFHSSSLIKIADDIINDTLNVQNGASDIINDTINIQKDAGDIINDQDGTEVGTNHKINTQDGTDNIINHQSDVKDEIEITMEEIKILEIMKNKPDITINQLTVILSGISNRKITRNIVILKKKGLLERVGSRKKGYWKVKR